MALPGMPDRRAAMAAGLPGTPIDEVVLLEIARLAGTVHKIA